MNWYLVLLAEFGLYNISVSRPAIKAPPPNFTLPADALLHTLYLMNKPVFNLMTVNTMFYDAYKLIGRTDQRILTEIYPHFQHLCGAELHRLLWLGDMVKDRLHETVTADSVIQPESIPSVEYALRALLGNPHIGPADKKNCVCHLASHLEHRRQYSVLAHLLSLVETNLLIHTDKPAPFHYATWYQLAVRNPSQTISLLKAHPKATFHHFAYVLAATSVSVHNLEPLLNLINTDQCPGDAMLSGIAHSCALDLEKYPSDTCALLHTRNATLLARLEAVNPACVYVQFVGLINNVRFRPDSYSSQELKLAMNSLRFVCNQTFCDESMSSLLAAIVHANRPDLFQTIWAARPPQSASTALERAILKDSAFVDHLSVADVRRFQNTRLQTQIIKSEMRKHNLSVVTATRCIARFTVKLAIIAELESRDSFIAAARYFVEQNAEDTLIQLLSTLINHFDNPVPSVFIILSLITKTTDSKFATTLGSCKFLRPLLLDKENHALSLNALRKFQIKLTGDFIQALLDDSALAAALASERGRFILEHLYIESWSTLLLHDGLSDWNIVRLFAILQMPIKDVSFNYNFEYEPLRPPTAFNHCDRARYVAEPGFLILAIRIIGTTEASKNAAFLQSAVVNAPNPFLLKSLHLFALWQHCNPTSFAQHAPANILISFRSCKNPLYAPNPLLPGNTEAFKAWCPYCPDALPSENARAAVDALKSRFAKHHTSLPLESFDPYELWRNHDEQNFVNMAPAPAVRSFFPKSMIHIIKCVLDRHIDHATQAYRLADVYLRNRSLRILFDSKQSAIAFENMQTPAFLELLRTVNCKLIWMAKN